MKFKSLPLVFGIAASMSVAGCNDQAESEFVFEHVGVSGVMSKSLENRKVIFAFLSRDSKRGYDGNGIADRNVRTCAMIRNQNQASEVIIDDLIKSGDYSSRAGLTEEQLREQVPEAVRVASQVCTYDLDRLDLVPKPRFKPQTVRP